MSGIGTSNDQKYTEVEANPLLHSLMKRLFAQVQVRVDAYMPTSLLDAGCGEGHAHRYLRLPDRYLGIDANPECVGFCRQVHPEADFREASVYALDLPDRSYDVVLCMEVLEHLEHPGDGLRELCRVAARGVVLTVPFEPLFQIGNAMRGKYRAHWGNHPEHIQHWGWRSFRQFLVGTDLLVDVSVAAAGPWLVASGIPAR